ncbi:YceI family protein [Pontibacter locisalis]|uniref:YceI family protein n=1 Tax=Pontibacter locisalis TaxID=1719035 RepID=A0ABW5ILG3_9BACT
MKKTLFYSSFAAVLLMTACGDATNENTENTTIVAEEPVAAEGQAYEIVEEESKVNWHGTKVAGEHRGEIELQDGQLLVNNNQLAGGTVVVDMKTITNSDIEAEEDRTKLEGHLKSDDFFGVEKYPTATFEITNATPVANAGAGQPNYNVEGNLTIKEKTEKVSFPATVQMKGNMVKASADVTVDRSKFDVRYGSNSFFDNLGDKAISDEFTISFDVTAKQ